MKIGFHYCHFMALNMSQFLSSVNQKYSYLVHRDDVRFKLDY